MLFPFLLFSPSLDDDVEECPTLEGIIDQAEAREESHLADHVLRYRSARQKKSKDRFKNFDISSGGLQGPALKSWQSVKKTHDHVISTAKLRVDVDLPKHVEEERLRLRGRLLEKWKSFDPNINGGVHGVEPMEWSGVRGRGLEWCPWSGVETRQWSGVEWCPGRGIEWRP